MPRPPKEVSPHLRAAPWAIGACLLWGSAFAGVKFGLRYMPPLTFAGMRFILAGLMLLPLCGPMSSFRDGLRSQWTSPTRCPLPPGPVP